MTEFSQVTASLRSQMKATLVRPDLLEPLLWPMIIFMAGAVGLALVGAPNRTITLCGVLLVLTAVLYGVVYIGCLLARPDALKAETITVGPSAPSKSESEAS
jgi:hypothetical protein